MNRADLTPEHRSLPDRQNSPEGGTPINYGQVANEYSTINGRILQLEMEEEHARELWAAGGQGQEQHRLIQDRISEAEAELTSLTRRYAGLIVYALGIIYEADRIIDRKQKDTGLGHTTVS